jgi:ubiquinone/menaquinone biosynthesis C-methylase UbiE
VSFDRAVPYYDRTRGLSDRTTERIVQMLIDELRGHEPCLEIGVGTGRMSLPLHGAGIRVMGADLSEGMMRRLVERAGGRPFPLARADATVLPFRPDAFGAGMACHVLHLIPDWRSALDQLIRTIRPGGLLLVDVGGSRNRSLAQRIERRFFHEAGTKARHPGVDGPVEVDRFLASLGARLRLLPSVRETRTLTIDESIRRLEQGLFSNTWPIEPVVRRRAANATRRWAGERFGNLDRPRRRMVTIQWRAYDLP